MVDNDGDADYDIPDNVGTIWSLATNDAYSGSVTFEAESRSLTIAGPEPYISDFI